MTPACAELARAGREARDDLLRRQVHFGIVRGDPFAQREYARLQSVSALLFLNDAHSFAPNYVRREQIRFTQTETNVT